MPLDQRGKSYDELLATIRTRDQQLRKKQILVEAMHMRQDRYLEDMAQVESDRDVAIARAEESGENYDATQAQLVQKTAEVLQNETIIEQLDEDVEEAEEERNDAQFEEHQTSRSYEEARATIRRLTHESDDAKAELLDAEARELSALRMFEGSEEAIRRLTRERDEARRQNGAKSGELFRFSAQVNRLKADLAGSREATRIEAYACDRARAELEDIQVERELAQKRWTNTQMAFAKAVERLSYPPLTLHPDLLACGVCDCPCLLHEHANDNT